MTYTDLFVYAVMLVMAPIFLVIFGTFVLLTAPVWVPVELYHWWVRRA